MGKYRRMLGKRRWPGGRKKKSARELVYLHTRINGERTTAISPQLLEKTRGLPWHARRARLHALTGIPFAEIPEVDHGHETN